MNKKIIIAVSVLMAVLLVSAGFLKNNKKPDYLTSPVEKHTITQVVEASGTVQPVQTVSIGSQVSGMIKEIYVDYNSKV